MIPSSAPRQLEIAARIQYDDMHDLETELKSAEAALKKRLKTENALVRKEVDSAQVVEAMGQWIGTPVSRLIRSKREREKLLCLEEQLRQCVVGQLEAVTAVNEDVRHRPYAVVLFDEMEKAGPDVSNVLLQVPDDGRLTDGQSRSVNFTNTIIVMTSNIGAQTILKMTEKGEPDEVISAHVRTLLKKHLRREMLKRIDMPMVFHQLRKKDLADIVDIQVGSLRERLKARGLDLELTPAAVSALADERYDPAFGARHLKRVIQQRLENEIAKRMLEGKLTNGDLVRVDAAGHR